MDGPAAALRALGLMLALALALSCGAAAGVRVGPPVASFHAPGGGGAAAAAAAQPEPPAGGCFDWTLTASIAREAFDYPSATTGGRRRAEAGALIDLQCDSAICPPPAVRNCFMADDVCRGDEWCLLEDQVKFGPWALGVAGETPNIKYTTCAALREGNYTHLYARTCGGRDDWGPWLAVRGRCVKYRCGAEGGRGERPRAGGLIAGALGGRQRRRRRNGCVAGEPAACAAPTPQDCAVCKRRPLGAHAHACVRAIARALRHANNPQSPYRNARRRQLDQSCNAYIGGGSAVPHYAVDPGTGSPPARPLLCAPGLVCTGEVQPVPHTCVRARPRDTCYQVRRAAAEWAAGWGGAPARLVGCCLCRGL